MRSAAGLPRDGAPVQAELFETTAAAAPASLPEGLHFAPEFLSDREEADLLRQFAELPLEQARYKSYTARRRIASYGGQYDYARQQLLPAEPIPDFLLPLRARVAHWAGLAPVRFSSALVAEYRPGTPLGWHRDVPDYEVIAGVSLGSTARMRLRPYPPVELTRADVRTLELLPRSAYLMQGAARWGWQHSIAPTPALRYSITFRTRRERTR